MCTSTTTNTRALLLITHECTGSSQYSYEEARKKFQLNGGKARLLKNPYYSLLMDPGMSRAAFEKEKAVLHAVPRNKWSLPAH